LKKKVREKKGQALLDLGSQASLSGQFNWGPFAGLTGQAYPSFLKKKLTRQMFCPASSHYGGQKIRAYVFLPQKLIFKPLFDPKHI
jgi:hypothetical protein